jgi:hypothetical protein
MLCFAQDDPLALSKDTLCFGVSAFSREPSESAEAVGQENLRSNGN